MINYIVFKKLKLNTILKILNLLINYKLAKIKMILVLNTKSFIKAKLMLYLF